MDVIALHQAGFAGAVAPLGTALTEDQLDELWRLSPMPVLCFDGDAAGARAAARAAELALPLLAPERSLRLAGLPAGEDPDTLVARQGRRRRSRRCWTPRARWPRRCSTCCASRAAKPRPSSAPPCARGWKRRPGASATAGWRRNIAAPCSTASLPTAAARHAAPAPRPAALPPRPPDPAAARQRRGRSLLVGILLRHPVPAARCGGGLRTARAAAGTGATAARDAGLERERAGA